MLVYSVAKKKLVRNQKDMKCRSDHETHGHHLDRSLHHGHMIVLSDLLISTSLDRLIKEVSYTIEPQECIDYFHHYFVLISRKI